MRKELKVIANNETFTLGYGLVSGALKEGNQPPVSLYCGPVDLESVHLALYYANRTVLRLLVDEFNVPLDKTDDFLVSAMSEALVKEYNNSVKGQADLDYVRTHIHFCEEHKGSEEL